MTPAPFFTSVTLLFIIIVSTALFLCFPRVPTTFALFSYVCRGPCQPPLPSLRGPCSPCWEPPSSQRRCPPLPSSFRSAKGCRGPRGGEALRPHPAPHSLLPCPAPQPRPRVSKECMRGCPFSASGEGWWAFLVAQLAKEPPAVRETWVRSLGWEDPLEEGTATHSSTLAWRIPWTEEPGGLQSMGSQNRTRLSD